MGIPIPSTPVRVVWFEERCKCAGTSGALWQIHIIHIINTLHHIIKTHTLVTEAKNTLSISENDGANVWLMPALKERRKEKIKKK
jgi:hypothetical protein